MELLRNVLEKMGIQKKKLTDDLFWSQIGSEIRGGGSNNLARHNRRSEGGREDQYSCLANPALHFDELVWGENGWTELGEEQLDPQMESLLLDQEFLAIVNHDSGNDNAGFLALDCLCVGLSIGEPFGVLAK